MGEIVTFIIMDIILLFVFLLAFYQLIMNWIISFGF